MKCTDYNQDILPGKSVTIGLNGTYSGEIGIPSGFVSLGKLAAESSTNYTYDFTKTSSWNSGFIGNLIVNNLGSSRIEDWIIEFDYPGEISRFYDAIILSHIGNHYVIKNVGYNANIKAQQTMALLFQGTKYSADKPVHFQLKSMILDENQIYKSQVEKLKVQIESELNMLPDSGNYMVDHSYASTLSMVTYYKETGDNYYIQDDYFSSIDAYTACIDYLTEAKSIFDELKLKFLTIDNNPTGDYDGDQLPNIFEKEKLSSEGLPYRADTNGNKVNDTFEDPDHDGLDNLQEYTYGTDPLNSDSDQDTLSDGMEISMGLNPLSNDSNENSILDGDELYSTTKEASEYARDPDVWPSIEMTLPGKSIHSLTIECLGDMDLSLPAEMPGYIGSGYDFKLDTTFESARLTYHFNMELHNDPTFAPAIYYCDEVNQEMVLLDNQEIDWENGTVTTTVTHFSKYILLNSARFESVWDPDIKAPTQINEPNRSFVIAMSIDSSGSMSWNDPNNIRKDAAKDFVDQLGDDDKAAIVDFDYYATVLSGLTSDKSVLYSAIDRIDSDGGTDIASGVSTAINIISNQNDASKYIVLLTDGEGYYDPSLTQRAKDLGITIYTIGLGSSVDENLLVSIAEETGGKYFHAMTSADLVDVFADTASETIYYETDSDNDGISDYFENLMAQGKIRTYNGMPIFADKDNADTDSDGVVDGEEVIIKQFEMPRYLATKTQTYVYYYSNTNCLDSDYDGIPDGTKDYDGMVVEKDANNSRNLFSGMITNNDFTYRMTFNNDYRNFFKSNPTYQKQLAVLGSVYATLAYHNNISLNYENYINGDIIKIYQSLGLKNIKDYELAKDYHDDDISEMILGHREVTYNNQTKDIVIIAVRGTDSTIEEWSSNFDVGADVPEYWDRSNPF